MGSDLMKNGFSGVNHCPEIFSELLKSGYTKCTLVLKNGHNHIKVFIRNNRIDFIISDAVEYGFFNFLRSKKEFDEDKLKKAEEEHLKKNIRLGKACMESGIMDYNSLWRLVREHQMSLADQIIGIDRFEYFLDLSGNENEENILLDLSLEEFILRAVRYSNIPSRYRENLEMIEKIFVSHSRYCLPDALFPFERHVYDLGVKHRDINIVLEKSELKEDDTLKYLYYYYLTGVFMKQSGETKDGDPFRNDPSGYVSFNSYEEALRYYNIKFEMIYKILSKEIGPVAFSILTNSIEEVKSNLPVFLKSAEIDKNGRLVNKKILKKVWYHEFEKHGSDFVRGLEEILYSQIFAIKKNIGIDYENQILKWLKGTGS